MGFSLGGFLGDIVDPFQALDPVILGGAKHALGSLIPGLNPKAPPPAWSDPFGSQRPQYQAQLSSLMNNPSSITSTPGYSFGLDQGEQALERSNAARGFLGSGNAATSMDTYAQNYAQQFLQQQIQQLAYLSGAGIGPPNLGSASNWNMQPWNMLGDLGSMAGFGAGMMGGGGAAAAAPAAMMA